MFWIFTNIFPKIEMFWHCESWSAKRCPWYCILIQLESKRNANCIFFCTIYPRDICVQKYFCCGTVCISLDANVVLPGLLVAPFFSSLAPPRGKYFSLLQESNSARYANRTMLPEEILSICHQLWIKIPNMFSQPLTEKKTNKEKLTKDTTTASTRGSESKRVGIQHYLICALLVFFYTVPIESCTTMVEASIVCPSGHLSNFCAGSSFKVAFV